MTAPRLLLLVLALLGLLAALNLLFFTTEQRVERGDLALVDQGSDTPGLASSASPQSVTGLALYEAADESAERTEVLIPGDAALREVQVSIRLPQGSPMDDSLTLVALDATRMEAGANGNMRRRINEESGLVIASVPVGRSAVIRMEIPEATDVQLFLDGRFLFLDELQSLGAEDSELLITPRLGACLRLKIGGDTSSAKGDVSVAGGSFGGGRGGGGWQRREQDAEGQSEMIFRGLDAELSWTVMANFEELYSAPKFGLELEAGKQLDLPLELTPGVKISGVVVDSSGAPLAGVEVGVAAGMMNWMGGATARNTDTDDNGEFQLSAVSPGDQKLEAKIEGWRTAESEDFSAEDGDHIKGIRLVLDPGESIRGVVRWPDGNPATGAVVSAESLVRSGFGNWGRSGVRRAGSTECDSNGNFELSGLKPGSYTLRASASKDSSSADETLPLWHADQSAVDTGITSVILVLTGPLAFTGRVQDERGEPVEAFELEARSAEEGGPRERENFEDPEGRFVFARVGQGEWTLKVSATGYTQAEPAKLTLTTEGTDLQLNLERTVTLAGTVVDSSGKVIAGALVRADDGSSSGNAWTGPSGPTSLTNKEGFFSFEELSAGTISVSAGAENWADSESTTLQLEPGDVFEDATLQLRVGGQIEGTVLTPEGDPIVNQRVTWGSNSMGFGSNDEVRSDTGGRFVFMHVTPGDWAVSAAPSMADMGARMSGRRDASAFTEIMGQLITETVSVIDGEVTEVSLGGDPRRPVRVHGVVTLAGVPLAGANVVAVSESSAVFEGMKSAPSAEDGSFELIVDRPGPHTISARFEQQGVAVAVMIPDQDDLSVNLAIPLGRIEGQVRKSGERTAAGIRVTIQREDGLGRMRWGGDQATTDDNGNYSIQALEEGRYTVRANASSWGGRADSDWGTMVLGGVEVGRDEVKDGVDFILEAAGSVSGVVLTGDGTPVADASLFFRDSAGRMISTVSNTNTNAAGEFSFEGLAPGDYSISVRSASHASSDAHRVVVGSDETAEIRIELEAATVLLVSLEDSDGELLRARFEVLDEDGIDVGSLMTLETLRSSFNQGGAALQQRVGPLPAGRYTVRATLADGRTVERGVSLRGRAQEKKLKLKLKD
jgi:protocatechuate 3,4-dioxygenase beta subunit